MIRLTSSGKWLLAVMAALYLASITSQSGLLLLLIGILSGCYLVNGGRAWRALRHLELTAPASTQIAEGARLTDPWRVANRGQQAAALIEVVSPTGTLFRVANLAAGASAHAIPDLVFARRGVYPYGAVRLTTTFPFGLVRLARRQALAGEIVVHPAVYPVPVPRAAGYDLMVGGKHQGPRRSTSGSNFTGVRPLQPGDPLKQIHWRSSSKGLGLMVKTYAEELSGRVAVLIDPGSNGVSRLTDDCLRAAGSLIYAALDEGHHVEWMDLASVEPHLIPPFDDGRQLLDALARLEMRPQCLTRDRLTHAFSRVSHKAAVCLVMTEIPPWFEDGLREFIQRNRIVTLYLPAAESPRPTASGFPVWFYHSHQIVPTA